VIIREATTGDAETSPCTAAPSWWLYPSANWVCHFRSAGAALSPTHHPPLPNPANHRNLWYRSDLLRYSFDQKVIRQVFNPNPYWRLDFMWFLRPSVALFLTILISGSSACIWLYSCLVANGIEVDTVPFGMVKRATTALSGSSARVRGKHATDTFWSDE